MRYLIVNADDFGQTAAINRGVIAAHRHGIVTSASLMVRWPSSMGAAVLARNLPSLSVGLHADLGEWAYRRTEWVQIYGVVPTEDAAAVRRQVEWQVARFRHLIGRDPTHIDAHQHVHRNEPVRSILLDLADTLGIPLRGCTARVTYRGDFYGQDARGYPVARAITVEALTNLIEALPTGVTELGCHPGEPDTMDSMYVAERVCELATLCDQRVRDAVNSSQVTLISFAALPLVERDSTMRMMDEQAH